MSQIPVSTVEECQAIFDKPTLSQEDRFILQRMPFRSLAGEYSDLTMTERSVVNDLEEKNLYKIINASCLLLGIYGEELQQRIMGSRFISTLFATSRDRDVPEKTWKRAQIKMALAHILSDFNDNPNARPVFDGKIPSRPFKFRQATAESWFNDIVSLLTLMISDVYIKNGADDAFAFLGGIIANHLYRTQPDRYPVSSYANENDAVYGILVSYFNRVGGDSSLIPR